MKEHLQADMRSGGYWQPVAPRTREQVRLSGFGPCRHRTYGKDDPYLLYPWLRPEDREAWDRVKATLGANP